jgi:hypothetical protein
MTYSTQRGNMKYKSGIEVKLHRNRQFWKSREGNTFLRHNPLGARLTDPAFW